MSRSEEERPEELACRTAAIRCALAILSAGDAASDERTCAPVSDPGDVRRLSNLAEPWVSGPVPGAGAATTVAVGTTEAVGARSVAREALAAALAAAAAAAAARPLGRGCGGVVASACSCASACAWARAWARGCLARLDKGSIRP